MAENTVTAPVGSTEPLSPQLNPGTSTPYGCASIGNGDSSWYPLERSVNGHWLRAGGAGRPRTGAAIGLVASLVSAVAVATAMPSYQVIPLPLPVSTYQTEDYGYGINNSGQVTGTIGIASAACTPGQTFCYLKDPFIYDPVTNVVTDLGTIGNANGVGYAINDSGVVVGSMETASGSCAFLYQNSALSVLPSLAGETTCTQLNSAALAINSGGLIVGRSDPTSGASAVPTVWSQGKATGITLPTTPAAASQAAAVNNANVIAGEFFSFKYPSGPSVVFTTEIGLAINNAGQVAGFTNGSFPSAYVYANGVVTVLPQAYPLNQPNSNGTIAGQTAYAINNAGQIVGTIDDTNSTSVYPEFAFFYQNGAISDLNTLVTGAPAGLQLTAATGINDSGWIVANGKINGNCPCVFLLKPTTPFPPAAKLYVHPASITTGGSVTLSWTDQSVTSCAASGGSGTDGWSGAQSTGGGSLSLTESGTGTVTYTLTCQSPSGAVSSSVSVGVDAPLPPPASAPPPSSGGGGAIDGVALLGLGVLAMARRRVQRRRLVRVVPDESP